MYNCWVYVGDCAVFKHIFRLLIKQTEREHLFCRDNKRQAKMRRMRKKGKLFLNITILLSFIVAY
jgi:hypothetical protein